MDLLKGLLPETVIQPIKGNYLDVGFDLVGALVVDLAVDLV